MRSLFDQYEIDDAKKDGVDIEYPANGDGTIPTFKVRCAAKSANPKYWKMLAELMTPYQHLIRAGKFSDSQSMELTRRAFVEHVLIDWSNVKRRDGQAIQFSKEGAIEFFKQLPELFNDLQRQADDLSRFTTAQLEEQAKN